MLLDFEVRSCSRRCAKTERELQPGDSYFSVLTEEGAELVRTDYSSEAWEGEPEDCVGWWRSRVPTVGDSKPKLAPIDVMLNLFATLADRAEDEALRYLLGLLLLRKRTLRRDDAYCDEDGREVLALFCPRRNENFELITVPLEAEEMQPLQERMIQLLYCDAEGGEVDESEEPAS